ncbi:MAG: acyl-CoA dehydrogenase [Proteobacteria bacterium]|nr:acyl-CoA dehydrogenase [Pseudomonadota bacterium]
MFDLELSKEQKMIKDEVAKLVKDLVTEQAKEWDLNCEIPMDTIQKAWELGASVSAVPEDYGGFGMTDSPITTAIILEELAFGDMAFAVAATTPSTAISPLLDSGTKEQQAKYLPIFCPEEYSPCTLGLNEEGFGFDPLEPKTTAVKKNGAYVLNGKKVFVPMADRSSYIMIAATLDGAGNLFIVDRNNPGLTVGEREKNLGLYALDSNEVTLENCAIPAEDRLGGENGCDYAKFLQKCRIGMSAIGTGVSRASYEFARDYAKDRVQFGEPIVYRQSIAFNIADIATEVDSMRMLTWKAASRLENGKDAQREAYLAKLYTGDNTMSIVNDGVQILGGHGYVREYPVERFYRNGRGIGILEGMATV